MISALRSIKVVPQYYSNYLILSSPKYCCINTPTSSTRFLRTKTMAQPQPADQNKDRDIGMDLDIEEAAAGPDLMAHSFGEGYATRADEEGFGGIYGANQTTLNKQIHENHPAYDKNQGCEVKEKEKARNQKSATS